MSEILAGTVRHSGKNQGNLRGKIINPQVMKFSFKTYYFMTFGRLRLLV